MTKHKKNKQAISLPLEETAISQAAYMCAIQNLDQVGNTWARAIVDQFDNPKEAWETLCDPKRISKIEGLTATLRASIKCSLLADEPKAIQEAMDDCHIKGIAYTDGAFPSQLHDIFNPPVVLFYRGNLDLLQESRMIAMVGARKCSAYGRNVAHHLGKELGRRGIVVISGGARGIDRHCHEGALQGHGATIAVMGCGLDVTYPRENGMLFANIVEAGGLLLSEYPPHVQPKAHHFPTRNRIIEGLARAVVVVEAKSSSGSLITADMAINDGRDVFAVPGNILDRQAAGNHWLLRQVARLVTCVEDILDQYNWNESGNDSHLSKPVISFTLDENAILDHLRTDKARQVDDIIELTGLSVTNVTSALLSLEMKDMIENIPSQGYILTGIRSD